MAMRAEDHPRELFTPVLSDPEAAFEVESRPVPSRWGLPAVVSSALVCAGLCAAAASKASSFSYRSEPAAHAALPVFVAELGEIIIEADAQARLPAKSCFESKMRWEPLNMKGKSQYKEDTVHDCVKRCRRTEGCAKISYWTDRGCHLADKDATKIWTDKEGLAGEASCDSDAMCFSNNQRYDPLDMLGSKRHRDVETAEKCQALCAGMPGCAHFAWWPDGGCHMQDKDATLIMARSKIVSGPAKCPSMPAPMPAPTKAPTKAPTPSPTAAPRPSPTPAPTAAPTPAPKACDETISSADKGASYRGCQKQTTSGKVCQRWDSQTPHPHDRTLYWYPSSGLESNFCRNPDDSPTIWCYTTELNTRWEECKPLEEAERKLEIDEVQKWMQPNLRIALGRPFTYMPNGSIHFEAVFLLAVFLGFAGLGVFTAYRHRWRSGSEVFVRLIPADQD